MNLRAAVLLAALLMLPSAAGDFGRSIDMAEFGHVELLTPDNKARELAIVMSDADGPGQSDRAAIRALSNSGFAVAVIDAGQAVRKLDKVNPGHSCVDLLGPLEWLSSTAERESGWSRYRPPLLLGHGAGGSLVYAALAQAPRGVFAGGASIDLRRELLLRSPLCRLATNIGLGGRQTLLPNQALSTPWYVGTTSASAPAAETFVAAAGGGNVPSNAVALGLGPLASLYSRAAERLIGVSALSGPMSVSDLPLVEVTAKTSIDTLAIIYSGDGGWRDIDKQVGEVLAARGMAVVGVDCLRYFWSALTPRRVGADLRRILSHYTSAWHIRHAVLIGYSFGADILPFAYNRLPPDLQNKVNQISLLAPGRAADFEIRPLGWFGAGPSDEARPISPETARIESAKMQCIFGMKDADDSLCTDASARRMEVIAHRGGHHFGNDYDALAKAVLAGVCRRSFACRM